MVVFNQNEFNERYPFKNERLVLKTIWTNWQRASWNRIIFSLTQGRQKACLLYYFYAAATKTGISRFQIITKISVTREYSREGLRDSKYGVFQHRAMEWLVSSMTLTKL